MKIIKAFQAVYDKNASMTANIKKKRRAGGLCSSYREDEA